MVTVGSLVKEECSVPTRARMGTITKVTDIVLHETSCWKERVDEWVRWCTNANTEPDMNMCPIVRPGKVASVRWQDDPTNLTVHVFYGDSGGRSYFSYGSNAIELVV